MGQSAVALRYAEALYELAREAGRGDEVLRDLAALRSAFESDPKGLAKLLHPRVSKADKVRALDEHFLAGRDRLVANLLRLLVRKDREEILRDFFRAYQETYDQREGIVRVEVESASPIDASTLESIRARVAEQTGRVVIVESRMVKELLGGLRFVVDSRVVDGSVRNRLERMRRRLLASSVA